MMGNAAELKTGGDGYTLKEGKGEERYMERKTTRKIISIVSPLRCLFHGRFKYYTFVYDVIRVKASYVLVVLM